MNAYINFIKSICFDPLALETHAYFYIRMELALCKLELCKDLFVFESLKSDYRYKFSLLVNHITECLEKRTYGMNFSSADFNVLKMNLAKIENSDFNKTILDSAMEDLNQIFKNNSFVAYNNLETKVLSLSA
ncbi:hypothetical protein DU508_02740 [Pedobacter chinensis]|uniref:Uncharacterized protein n=1 Tax=Pedobacter chinensis TaxID=2282421 RepID=A0A369Q3Q2_9SPHI|nr:hypothetical protein [Pedobacter chinensis]RDC57887.1 hypothetical protein DU508_02740 [Pedobacter chinensis]